MTARLWYTIACNRCGEITPGGGEDMRSNRAEARAVARRYGWRCHAGVDLCPTCQLPAKARAEGRS